MTRLQSAGVDLVAYQDPPGGFTPLTEPPEGFKQYSLVFVVDKLAQKVLLGTKKRGFATGIVNGFGGKLDKGESITECAVRETWEECGLRIAPEDMHHTGELAVFVRGERALVIHTFEAHKWAGELVETEEMAPFWVPLDAIPFERMHPEAHIHITELLGPRTKKERFVGFIEANELDNLGWWMGWVPRE